MTKKQRKDRKKERQMRADIRDLEDKKLIVKLKWGPYEM